MVKPLGSPSSRPSGRVVGVCRPASSLSGCIATGGARLDPRPAVVASGAGLASARRPLDKVTQEYSPAPGRGAP